MADSGVRTEFGPAPGHVRSAASLLVIGPLLVAVPAWFAASRDRPSWYVAAVLLGLIGVAFAVAGLYLLSVWLPRYHLTFGPDGIHLQWQRRTIDIPWTDVRSWWLGIPPDAANAAGAGAPRPVLLVEPADHVTDPAAASRRTVWSRRRQLWAICEPDLTDGTAAEIRAALARCAPELAAESAPSGSVGDNAGTGSRLPRALIAQTVGVAALSLLAFAVAVWGFIAILDTGSGPALALAAVAVPGLVGALLAAGAMRLAFGARR